MYHPPHVLITVLPSCQKVQTGVTEETVQVADTTRQTCHKV